MTQKTPDYYATLIVRQFFPHHSEAAVNLSFFAGDFLFMAFNFTNYTVGRKKLFHTFTQKSAAQKIFFTA